MSLFTGLISALPPALTGNQAESLDTISHFHYSHSSLRRIFRLYCTTTLRCTIKTNANYTYSVIYVTVWGTDQLTCARIACRLCPFLPGTKVYLTHLLLTVTHWLDSTGLAAHLKRALLRCCVDLLLSDRVRAPESMIQQLLCVLCSWTRLTVGEANHCSSPWEIISTKLVYKKKLVYKNINQIPLVNTCFGLTQY